MVESERLMLDSLPDSVTIFRGCLAGLESGACWTLRSECAAQYAERLGGSGHVVRVSVGKEKVTAYFDRRGWDEIIVAPEHVNEWVEHPHK